MSGPAGEAGAGDRDYPTVIRGGLLVVASDAGVRVESGDLLMAGGRIERLGAVDRPPRGARVIYASGCAVLPGFVQSHVHLSHTLLRGLADRAETREELRRRLLRLEAAHTPESMRASARLGVAELLVGGSTAVQAMESVRHVDAVLEVLAEAGIFAVAGKSLIDREGGAPGLVLPTEQALRDAVDLAEEWDGAGSGRLRVCLAPRTVADCSDACLHEVARLAEMGGWRVQIESVAREQGESRTVGDAGVAELRTLERHGLLGPHVGLAHCVPSPEARRRLVGSGVHLLHCPGSEARRGLGVAQVAELRRQGLNVSIGADGPAAGSSLDMLQELRLMILLQQSTGGPRALSADAALDMASRAGAAALGWEAELGVLREGAVANVVLVSLEGMHTTPCPDPIGALVHGARSDDIRAVWLAGRQVVSEGGLTLWDEEELRRDARREARGLAERAGIAWGVVARP